MNVRARGDDTRGATRDVSPSDRPPLPVWIHVVGARARPARFRLTRGSCVIGAGKAGDVVVDHETVSRAHARLTLVPEGVLVEDLESTNGTTYLGQRVGAIALAPGSRFKIGHVDVAIEADAGALPTEVEAGAPEYRGILGASAAMRRLFAVLARLEGSLVNVLVEGESGTGKELIARAIHEGSSVAAGPLVVVNCGAIPRELVVSELFGHKKGAFTGANESRVGAFEAAHGGTLFLDEAGELPLEAQPVLLRALESGEVRPVGEVLARSVKVRVIAATNRDLQVEARAGRLREDLYYRLAVVKLTVPPLRDRTDDIELLAQSFAAAAGVASLPDDFAARLRAQAWPGNVRELRNAVQAFLAIGTLPGEAIAAAPALETALLQLIDPEKPYADQKDALLQHFTRLYLEVLLRHTGGNQSEAARISGLNRGYIGELAARHGVTKR
jgi:two-component system, NtrC family, response regulator GlrR